MGSSFGQRTSSLSWMFLMKLMNSGSHLLCNTQSMVIHEHWKLVLSIQRNRFRVSVLLRTNSVLGPRFGATTRLLCRRLTDPAFHLDNFARIASELAGTTDEVVVSFMQLYSKTRSNMDEAGRNFGFDWIDPPSESKRELLGRLVEIAAGHRMQLTLCTQPDLMVAGAAESRCVDAQRLMDVSDRPIQAKLKGMRTGCGCFESKDIGDYDSVSPWMCLLLCCSAAISRTETLPKPRPTG